MAERQSRGGSARIRLELLGGFAARDSAGREIGIASRKARALLAYLSVSPGKPQPREKLTSLLWSDRGEAQARASLRQALSELRRAFPESDPPPLKSQRDSIWLDPEAVEVDAATLERLVDSGAPGHLAQAAETYQGDFLDGLDVRDAAFEEWRRGERERLRERASQALLRLLDQQVGEQAIATARRLLTLDPLNEATHRRLMLLYAESGDRAMALRQYEACRAVLTAELGLSAEPETEKLAEEIAKAGIPDRQSTKDTIPSESPRASSEPPSLPDKPSVVVLPFVNMSGDPEQEYFSDGITEDIITELARFNSLFVIARNSSFHYKGQSPRIQDVGRDLGVQYVVEGSVRKASNRVRVTAQLVEAASGNHIWAERFDRNLEDIFAVQDEVVREIATAVPGQLDLAAIQRVQRRPTDNMTAYEFLMQAVHIRHQDWGSPDAAALLEKAVAADPHCALAYASLANWHAYSILAHGAPADEARRQTVDYAEKAIQFEPNDSTVLSMIGEAYFMSGDLELAKQCMDKAIKLNPNNYHVMSFAGVTFAYLGDIEEALRWHEMILRHDPISIEAIREASIEIYYMAERHDDSIRSFIGWHNPPRHVLAEIAAAYAQVGRQVRPQESAESMRQGCPRTTHSLNM